MHNSREHGAYTIFRNAMKMLAPLPRKWVGSLAVPLGLLWHGIDRNHRKIAFDNMSRAFRSEIDDARIRGMVRANFVQLARVVLEMPSLLRLSRDNLDTYVSFSGSRHLRDALSSGKGVLLFSAHLGNWELLALALSLKFDIEYSILVRPLDYAPVDRVLSDIRCRLGNTILDKIDSAGTIRKVLGERKMVAMMLDQNASWYDGVYVPFFGQTACTNKGFALFALRYGSAIIPAFSVRQQDGRYRIIINPPVPVVRSGNIERDVAENTAIYNRLIEKHIRMAPETWLWLHRRWRLKAIPEKAKKRIRVFTIQDQTP